MRIVVTGVGGNIGRGIAPRLLRAGHELVLVDLVRPRWLDELPGDVDFRQLDVQIGVGLDAAAAGCDLIVHLPAWHGIHVDERTEADFWRLNVDGTFWALQAARANGIDKFLFMSSQAWHNQWNKYGFTKRIGEDLLHYQREQRGLSFVAVRPAALTPWQSDWPKNYGERLLYGGVDREDVLDAIELSIAHLERSESTEVIVDALRPNAFTADQLENWELDPLGHLEQIYPGSRAIVDEFGLDVSRAPFVSTTTGWETIGYHPLRDFGTFVAEASAMSPAEARALPCPY